MAMGKRLLTVAAVLTTWLVTSDGTPLEIYDLTHPIGDDPMSWPLFPKFNFTILMRGRNPAGYWVEANKFEMAEHSGTHMDAPSHFSEGGLRVHLIPASRLIGPGVIIDVTEKVKSDAEYRVTVGDLQAWEEKYGRIPDGAVVLMESGWTSRYPDRQRVFNSRNVTDINSFRFPGFTVEAAQWLVDNRNITAVGCDTPSPDNARNYRNNWYSVHTALLPRNILILENVRMTADVPKSGTIVILGSINLREGSGAPMRLLAVRNALCASGGSTSELPHPVLLALLILCLGMVVTPGC